ncbi:BTB/POZ domain-containing protein KCTD9 [Coccinella septempunctata]|uniref:BTB/POZ domain-containing protein KCTD9 n=1 Tax=Coccinella septempunctata TaxID=41139 RepID=UPI001D06E5BE|nr:BTB/POZ domain-containing protein KCTD9 [Coccinella septempunctata]
MSEKKITAYKNGQIANGEEFVLPSSWEELKKEIYLRLNILPEKVFLNDGTEIKDITLIRHKDDLYVSMGENFIKPKNKKPSDWITLNVGGKYFTTSRSTLTSKEPTSMLARMFAESEDNYLFIPSNVDANGAYLIDRSPTYFEPILNYLRSGHLIYDTNVNPNGILQEAKFFGIDSIIPQLENLIVQTNDVPLTRRNVIDALIKSPYTAELRFQGVNLAGADLSKLDLRYINFKYANMQKCKLTGSNLSWCCLERADLSYTNIDGAQLLGVKGLCANFEGASMRNCNFNDPGGSRSNMEGVNLKFADLEESDMCGVNLRVATLKNANLQNCNLRAAVLAGTDLEKCDLSGSDLHEANLRGANLKDATFELMLTPLHMSQAIR